MANHRLSDLGERRIISEILGERYAQVAPNFGDDCVVLPRPSGHLVVTTDPCPEPAASYIGFDDWYYRGWLLATINLSDLAAAGASPLGILTSYELPDSTLVSEFERLLDGVDACLSEYSTSVLGGNIKESSHISLSATALGVSNVAPGHRQDLGVGDLVYLVGQSGDFWAGMLCRRSFPDEYGEESTMLDAVLRPRPQLSAGQALWKSGLVRSVTDNSDGLFSSLESIRLGTGLGFELELQDSLVTHSSARDVAIRLGIEPVRLVLGWGDWQLVTVCAEENRDSLEACLSQLDVPWSKIGRVASENRVSASYGEQRGSLMRLDSQRFTSDSWLTSGLDGYVNGLMGEPIIS
jgi:thiamine-monophosphate kinase